MRLIKAVYLHFVLLLTSWLPDVTPVLKLRGFLARPAFRRCGPNLQIARHVYIGYSSNMEVGRDVYIAYGVWIQAVGGITIDDEVLLGPYVVLVAGDHGLQDGSYRFGPPTRTPVHIARGCWLAAHATVTRGVTLGAGTLVGANAVVTRSTPEHSIVGGVPARVINA